MSQTKFGAQLNELIELCHLTRH